MTTRRLVLQSLPSALLLPLAAPTRAAAADVRDGSWLHAARQRTLPWRLRLPAGDGPCPLVLYSHGLGGSREGGPAWGSAWADAGVAVLHLQHPGSDVDVLNGGAGGLQAAASAEQLIDRLQDLRFAINELHRRSAAAEAPWTRMRADAIGVAGHSFGALTAQAVAGQRYPNVGDLSDPRPKAFVALSPSLPLGVQLSPREAFSGVERPFFALTGSLDASPLQRDDAGAQRAAVYGALPPGKRALLWLAGADHQTFGGGRPGLGETERRRALVAQQHNERHRLLIARATAAWWRWHLLGDEVARSQLAAAEGLTGEDRMLLG